MVLSDIRVYVQNKSGRAPAYHITEDTWRASMQHLHGIAPPTIRLDTDPDLEALEAAHVFVGSGFDRAMIRQHGTNLRLIHCTSAGVDQYLPLDWLPAGACFSNSRGIHGEKAAEYATMALLALSIGLPSLITAQHEKRWSPTLTPLAKGNRVLIVGLGKLGAAVAAAAGKLGMQVRAVTKHGTPSDLGIQVAPIDQLSALLPKTDYLVLCCPLTPETAGLIGRKELGLLPSTGGVVNMARGAVLDETALALALKTGRLRGAVLDVFRKEPLPAEDPIWDTPNLLMTPHLSCDVPDGYASLALSQLVPNMESLLQGRTPSRNIVSPELGY